MTKTFTLIQKLRKFRAGNKGIDRILARQLRELANILDRKLAGELSREEFRSIEVIIVDLTKRLKLDGLTQKAAKMVAWETRHKT